jgi:hypothetical protein
MKVAALAIVAIALVSSAAAGAEPPRERVCFSAAETREKIVMHKLTEPFRVMKSAAARLQGEAIAAKLCRWNQKLVYEISLLRRDGHVIHVFLDAANGQSIPGRDLARELGREPGRESNHERETNHEHESVREPH